MHIFVRGCACVYRRQICFDILVTTRCSQWNTIVCGGILLMEKCQNLSLCVFVCEKDAGGYS